MIETLTIINTAALITMFMIWPLVGKKRGANAFIHPRAGDKLSMLNRRRKALHLATKEWHGKVDRGYTNLAGDCKNLVDQLEREVAALEDELFGIKGECRKHVTTISSGHDELHRACYIAQCYLCDWYSVGFLREKAEAKGAEHERKHA